MVSMEAKLGKGALLANVDIESVYQLIPVHPDNKPLLAMQWNDRVFINGMLQFGFHSAPKIFNAVANAWALVDNLGRGVSRLWSTT